MYMEGFPEVKNVLFQNVSESNVLCGKMKRKLSSNTLRGKNKSEYTKKNPLLLVWKSSLAG